MMTIGLGHFLGLSAILFGCGVATLLTKRNAIALLMGIELILNAANINLVAFNRFSWSGVPAGVDAAPAVDGMLFVVFIIVLAAAEAAIALAIFLNFYNNFASIDIERGRLLKG
ncbi:MAG: NADH-quinone oxidoreductase subunit NuoK [Phycisphaerales bacterium]